jgi:hypothetical protein
MDSLGCYPYVDTKVLPFKQLLVTPVTGVPTIFTDFPDMNGEP